MFTLEDLLWKLIDDAKSLFGPAINDWQFAGIEFRNGPPSILYYQDKGEMTISLSEHVQNDDLQLIFQLSHEVCHLLHPSKEYPSFRQNKTIVLNEGISTYFSVLKLDEFYNIKDKVVESLRNDNDGYFHAYNLVQQLISLYPDSIKTLREKCPRIDRLTASDFADAKIFISEELMNNLLMPFN